MATRSAFKDNSYAINNDEGNYTEAVDLTIEPWNRQTVADGQWLNDRAIAPLSARDVYLADCIDATNSMVYNLTERVNSLDVTGEGYRAVSLVSLNRAADPNATALTSMISNTDAIVPAEGNYYVPSGSFSYFTIDNGGIIQANLDVGRSLQLKFTTAGAAFRTVAGEVGDIQQLQAPNEKVQDKEHNYIPYYANYTTNQWKTLLTAPAIDSSNTGLYVYKVAPTVSNFDKLNAGDGLEIDSTTIKVKYGTNIGVSNGALTAANTTYTGEGCISITGNNNVIHLETDDTLSVENNKLHCNVTSTTYTAGAGLTTAADGSSTAFKLNIIPNAAGTYVVTADVNGSLGWTTTSFNETFTEVSLANNSYLTGKGTSTEKLSVNYGSLKTDVLGEQFTFTGKEGSELAGTMSLSAAIQKLIDAIDNLTPDETTGG